MVNYCAWLVFRFAGHIEVFVWHRKAARKEKFLRAVRFRKSEDLAQGQR